MRKPDGMVEGLAAISWTLHRNAVIEAQRFTRDVKILALVVLALYAAGSFFY